ncbi:hypothetical protein HMN09_00067100 [Mycena chlorophos]|uniref:Uncharacterized protein n=1 Tax=Mycena chlorophos TaxID=658473 RepID=A0A8H6WMJ4_MYCCL|nr:hypothetical protein HMN09_00067100 [Mycena chlorophos]
MPHLRVATAPAIYDIPMMTSLNAPLHIRARRRVNATSSCSTSPRRRHSARRRHCTQTDCCPIRVSDRPSDCHPFDRLPWISALDATPDASSAADIADLSQLVIDEPEHASAGAGPIRRRKTSLRSNPLAHDPNPHTPPPHNHTRVEFRNLLPVFSCGAPTPSDPLLPSTLDFA